MKVFIFLATSILTLCSYQTDALSKSITSGKVVYTDYCMLCHKVDGNGTKGLIPPLAKADWLKDRKKTIHAVKYGLKGPITVNGVKYEGIMASQSLSDEEIADVVNYIFHTWGNDLGKIVTVEEVKKVKK